MVNIKRSNVQMTNFNDPNVQMGMKLFMLRGAYGYKGFSEQIDENISRSDAIAFREAIENSTKPFDDMKVSTLSRQQQNVLNRTSGGQWMIPLLNRMGELGLIDLRTELNNSKFTDRMQKNAYTATIRAYTRSI